MRTDSLLRNSLYLMLATAVMSGFGFVFWLITTHQYSTEAIGMATAVVSTMNLISLLALAGFDVALVRFLPRSKHPNVFINTALLAVGLAAASLGMGFLILLPRIAPELAFIRTGLVKPGVFTAFCICAAWNVLTDAVFLAYRRAGYTLAINTVFSSIKTCLPLLFVSFGAWGIVVSAGVASIVGCAVSLVVLVRRFGYMPRLAITAAVVRETGSYSGANYLAGLANLLPPTILPLLITNRLGAAQAAYFYIALMIANVLYVVPQATAKSLFAEGSHAGRASRIHVFHSAAIMVLGVVPASAILLLIAPVLLRIFGQDFSLGATALLRYMALAGLPVAGYNIIVAVCRVYKLLWESIILNLLYACLIVGGALIGMRAHGLNAVGMSWVLGHGITALVGLGWLVYRHPARPAQDALAPAAGDVNLVVDRGLSV